jgi:spartin
MGMKDKVLISADLILSTIDHSTRQLIDTSTSQFGKVMHHKYGEEAAESSTLMANTARNVGLVYVDMRGIGRRALLKRVGKTYIKSKVSSRKNADVPAGHAPAPAEK